MLINQVASIPPKEWFIVRVCLGLTLLDVLALIPYLCVDKSLKSHLFSCFFLLSLCVPCVRFL